jgi:pyruvate/2-oxoglutarate dehydrogenase complex dihydrolipoamide dehydrogenase (E3) component
MVVNCFKREANLEYAKELDLELSDNGKRIKGGFRHFLEQTNISHIFAAGDVLHGVVHNEPAAAISGRRVANYIHSLVNKEFSQLEKLREFNFDFMPYCLFTSPEIAGVGITQSKAGLVYQKGGFAIISLNKASYLDGLSHLISDMDPNQDAGHRHRDTI